MMTVFTDTVSRAALIFAVQCVEFVDNGQTQSLEPPNLMFSVQCMPNFTAQPLFAEEEDVQHLSERRLQSLHYLGR